MTSDGRPYARFRRALDSGSIAVIRSTAAELEHVELEDGLAICLAFLELEQQTFPRAATRWVARLTLERGLALEESQLALAAMSALSGPAARAGAEALIELCARHRLERVEPTIATWLQRNGLDD
ncbi:MAG: hypothetical protein ABSC56_10355 [Solirubrobacteraceae bacterium]|jgi:hypothetical protein